MSKTEFLEKRFSDLIKKPIKSPEEVTEVLSIGKELEMEYSKETSELILELRDKGIHVSSVWDLVNSKKSYPKAIDVLVKHLGRNYHDKNKEGIIRALAVKEAKGKALTALLDEFKRIPKNKAELKWVIGNTAFVLVSNQEEIESIFPIVLEKAHGPARERFIAALGKFNFEEVEDVLIRLLDDEEVTTYSLEALGSLKSKKALDKIRQLTQSSIASIRSKATQTLSLIQTPG